MNQLPADIQQQIQQAASVIRQSGVVVFPTETVYGLGANALDPVGAQKIYQIKGRPSNNPLIVHVANLDQLSQLTPGLSDQAKLVIKYFWPGPLTLILPKSPQVPDVVTAGGPTVAVRMPDHPIALALIESAGTPIAAPSANTSGYLSPTNFLDVYADLGDKVELLIDGGGCEVGLESTVLDLTSEPPMILRPGAITAEELEPILGEVIHYQSHGETVPKSPGLLYRHYSPKTELVLVDPDFAPDAAKNYLKQGLRVGVLTTDESIRLYPDNVTAISLGSLSDMTGIARQLFAALHQLDRLNVEIIIAENLPTRGIGQAIMNRLSRAAQKS